jgi:TolB-like protein
LLYETLTGRPAFPGATAAERLSAVLTDSPPPIERAGLPADINVILNRAFQKDPQERFANAGSFLAALQEASGGEWLDELPDSVVVLDFVNSGGSTEDDWIGRGIADTVHSDLSRSYGIEVMRRERMLELRAAGGRSLDPAETALALGARWVIPGNYQRSNEELLVNVSLIEASTRRVAVAQRIDRHLSELFAIESQIVEAVTQTLRPASPVRKSKEARPSLSAFECYARAQQLFDRRDRGSIGQAGELLMHAVKMEPTYAPALAALAGVHAIRFTYTSDAASLDKAIEYAQQAIRHDPNSAVAFTWLGYGLARKVSVPEAREAWRRAREADPSGFYAYYFDVPVAAFVGAPEEALHLARRAVELSSRSASPLWGLGCLHLTLGQYAEAKWCFLRCIDICARATGAEGSPGVEGCLGECLRRLRQFEEARRYCLQGVEHAEKTDYVYRDTNRVLSLVALGRTALDENDVACAEAAFSQAIAHIHGRTRTLAGGTLLVQALAGSARAQQKQERFDQAVKLFESRESYDFSWYWLCTDDVTCLDLARAAQTLRHPQTDTYFERARLSGSLEAQSFAAGASF